jgi:hypothetical protein
LANERHHRLSVGGEKRQASGKRRITQIDPGGTLNEAGGGVVGNFGRP